MGVWSLQASQKVQPWLQPPWLTKSFGKWPLFAIQDFQLFNCKLRNCKCERDNVHQLTGSGMGQPYGHTLRSWSSTNTEAKFNRCWAPIISVLMCFTPFDGIPLSLSEDRGHVLHTGCTVKHRIVLFSVVGSASLQRQYHKGPQTASTNVPDSCVLKPSLIFTIPTFSLRSRDIHTSTGAHMTAVRFGLWCHIVKPL